MSYLPSSRQSPNLSVRIVVSDYYLCKPLPGIDVIYSEFRGTDIKQVPVLRIFGPASDGHKACVHIHGVFPYFYIPCPSSNPAPQFLYQIAASLDKALNIALKQASSVNQHVYKISLVKGLPFYGFHDKEHLFLKIFLYNPGLIKQAVELCINGAILGQSFQPHESHLNFTLQFYIDFNLFGMSYIDLQSVIYRRDGNQPSNTSFDMNVIKPESVCYYEADCVASHIINRQRVGKGDGIENPGLEEVWIQEEERRKHLNVSMASKSLSQGRLIEETDSHKRFEKIIAMKLSGLIDKPIEVEIDNSNETIHYPAESMEGSQLLSALDVSVHVPDSIINCSVNDKNVLNETQDLDTTLVNEEAALNSTLTVHHSQVLLDSQDLDLVDMLKDLDENLIEEDSILKTPAEVTDNYCDDIEYSQVYDEDTILFESGKSEVTNNLTDSWNDSFWDGANIPQIDGTCDDDHVKKVRKRKMRPFKLGLSKPKSKKKLPAIDQNDTNTDLKIKTEPDSNDDSTKDVINESRETVKNISSLHLKHKDDNKYNNESLSQDISLKDLVEEISVKNELIDISTKNINIKKENKFALEMEPVAGPSNVKFERNVTYPTSPTLSDSEWSESEDLGFISFYDKSKFNFTLDEDEITKNEIESYHCKDFVNIKESNDDCNVKSSDISDDIKLYYSQSNPITQSKIITPKYRPPTKKYIESRLSEYNIPKLKNKYPFYSNHKDVGDKIELGEMTLKLRSETAQHQKPFSKVLNTTSIEEWRHLFFLQSNDLTEGNKIENLKQILASNKACVLQPVMRAPTKMEVIRGLNEHKRHNVVHDTVVQDDNDLDNSQAIGLNGDDNNCSSLECSEKERSEFNDSLQVTMIADGSFLCFGNNNADHTEISDDMIVQSNYLTVMVVEVLASVRGDLHPNPLLDPIQAVFIQITNDCPKNHFLQPNITEIFAVDCLPEPKYLDKSIFQHVTYVETESHILESVIELVRKHDPDILCGYEVEKSSWGYILERSEVLGYDMVMEISRITEKNRQKRWRRDDNDFEGRIIGRILFNVWRLFRHELALSSYSFENCMHEILKERVPKYSHGQLFDWWSDESRILRWIPVDYYLSRLSGTVRMLEKLDIINRTSELARLFGLQWWEVLSRGSQFRVESLMLRAARPLNLLALSPSVRQRAAMKAPECLPLIFEPQSRYYTDPVIVLDFQSLYPSMMIAYNYCFSTCIGRVQNINGDSHYEFGAWRLRIPKKKLESLTNKGLVHWSPVGVGFVNTKVRRGVLPALLRRILAARQAVKKNMKCQTDEAVKKMMHSRQLGLKLIANVTYGYTAANFSGRMPCVEVGDSVVSKGRETLERAIKMVENNTQWNVKVVYGDTDSMFVLVPGGSRQEAFSIGQQIADAVTADNPSPVALKLEKVYQPCILQTKKRYVGYMYESADQENPIYEAKGIETVRRDGCPAGVKLLQKSLCELFSSGDVSRVKKLVMSTLSKLVDGSIPVQDLFFTREYNGPNGYKPGASAPPNEIAKRLHCSDVRATPLRGERVSWLICSGAPGLPLLKLAKTPSEVQRELSRPHVAYYAARVILPPLHRCLSLLGADVFKWWQELGFSRESAHSINCFGGGITKFLWRERCAFCGTRSTASICKACVAKPQLTVAALTTRLNVATSHLSYCAQICGSCSGNDKGVFCENYECPVFWRSQTAKNKFNQLQDILRLVPVSLKCEQSLQF